MNKEIDIKEINELIVHGFRYLQWSYASYGYPGEVGKGVKCPHYRPF